MSVEKSFQKLMKEEFVKLEDLMHLDVLTAKMDAKFAELKNEEER